MGMDLYPSAEDAPDFSVNGYGWLQIMSYGVGLVIGAHIGSEPGQYFYCGESPNPFFNDGHEVSESDALVMARCARTARLRGIAVNDFDEDSQIANLLDRFANFAEKSGGFTIW